MNSKSKVYAISVLSTVLGLIVTTQPQKGSLVDMALALAGGSAGPGDSGDGSAGSNNSGTSSGAGGPSGHESNYGGGGVGADPGAPHDLFGGVGGIRGPAATGEISVTELSGPQTKFNDGWSHSPHTFNAPPSKPGNTLGDVDRLSSPEIGTSIRADAPTYNAGSFTDVKTTERAQARRDYDQVMSEIDPGYRDHINTTARSATRGDELQTPHDDSLTYGSGSRTDVQNTRTAEFERATAGLKGVDRAQQQADGRDAARGAAAPASTGSQFSGRGTAR